MNTHLLVSLLVLVSGDEDAGDPWADSSDVEAPLVSSSSAESLLASAMPLPAA